MPLTRITILLCLLQQMQHTPSTSARLGCVTAAVYPLAAAWFPMAPWQHGSSLKGVPQQCGDSPVKHSELRPLDGMRLTYALAPLFVAGVYQNHPG